MQGLVTADDRVFLGEGLFETIKVHQSIAPHAKLHWQRMRKNASLLGIRFELGFTEWDKRLLCCIQDTNIKTGVIKVILTGGSAPRGLTASGVNPLLMITASSDTPTPGPLHLIPGQWLRDAKNPIYQYKSINYLEAIMARRAAIAAGADDVLFFNLDHHATETTVANLFIIKDNQLYTPLLSDGVLAGITRGRLLKLCGQVGIGCQERSIDINLLIQAEAVFVTNSIVGIQSVKLFNQTIFKTNHPLIAVLQNALETTFN